MIDYNRSLVAFETIQTAPADPLAFDHRGRVGAAPGPARRAPPSSRARSRPSVTLLDSRAEADRHGHHPERSGEHRGGARIGRLGRRDHRRRLREHRRHRRDSRGRTPRASRCATWPGYSAQKNYAASLALPRLDPVARRRRARHAGARRRDPGRLRRGPVAPRLPHPAHRHYLGRWIRGTDWYPDYQLRLYDRRAGAMERPPRPRIGRVNGAKAADPAAPARRPAALPLSRHQPPPRDDRPLHDARRRADGRPKADVPSIAAAIGLIRRSRSCATTSCAAASGRAAPVCSCRCSTRTTCS